MAASERTALVYSGEATVLACSVLVLAAHHFRRILLCFSTRRRRTGGVAGQGRAQESRANWALDEQRVGLSCLGEVGLLA